MNEKGFFFGGGKHSVNQTVAKSLGTHISKSVLNNKTLRGSKSKQEHFLKEHLRQGNQTTDHFY